MASLKAPYLIKDSLCSRVTKIIIYELQHNILLNQQKLYGFVNFEWILTLKTIIVDG